jgi:tRNA1Val (adenine37-N6)-methyltransferase
MTEFSNYSLYLSVRMSDSIFRFRQFSIHQEKCAMKVGTDAVLLGSWVDPKLSKNILDIGTGTGLIALMLAQKSPAEIDAIDIDGGACKQADENFSISPWSGRIHIFHQPLQDFAESSTKKYDLVVTNPPYFHHASKPSEEARLNARHNDQLSFEELICGVKKILTDEGRFCLILPCKEGGEFMDMAQQRNLFCHELIRVRTRADKSEKRWMMEFGFHFGLLHDHEITIQEDDHEYTAEYIEMTKDYFIGLK